MARGKTNPPPAQPNQQSRKPEPKHWLEYAIFAFVILTAFGTGAAAWYARKQWLATVDTEIVSNRALVISNRINFISYGDPSQADRTWQISAVFENVGNTPTKYLRFIPDPQLCFMGTEKEIGDNPSFPWRNAPRDKYHKDIIGPKSDINGIVAQVRNTQIANCRAAVVFMGLVKYFDIFKAPHIMEFCNYIISIEEFKTYPAGQIVRVPSFPCEQHNCTDDECGPDWRQRAGE